MLPLGRIEDISKLSQDFPDGARGAGGSQTSSGQIRIAMQIVENGTWPRGALQVLWWRGTDLDNALDHAQVGGWWRSMTSARARKEHLHIVGISIAKPMEPFFDKAGRAIEKGSQLALCPVRMMASQPGVARRAWQPIELPEWTSPQKRKERGDQEGPSYENMKQVSGSDGSISHLFKRREDPVKEEMNAIG